jgi:hypothetical protein
VKIICELFTLLPPAIIHIGSLFEAGSVRGQSIRPYVVAIGAQHRRFVQSAAMAHELVKLAQHRRFVQSVPTAHELVKLARRGVAAAEYRRRSGEPLRSAAY